ncbi:MAG TPA: large conductance mechanosensitive channel protein MscL [Candidatus Aquilonibacter sp.]|nr:large conductance mechanosensitive channel protein MscL [Candidatus Aquilonibacter sp.]
MKIPILQEFKEFALRGNVADLAVGVILGTAFGKIVSALVSDIIMPPISRLVGNIDFTNLYFPLSEKVRQAQEAYEASPATSGQHLPLASAQAAGPVLAWGDFVTITLNFLIVAFCIFLMVKGMNTLKRKEEAKPTLPPEPSPEEKLLTEIRDLLKNRPLSS